LNAPNVVKIHAKIVWFLVRSAARVIVLVVQKLFWEPVASVGRLFAKIVAMSLMKTALGLKNSDMNLFVKNVIIDLGNEREVEINFLKKSFL
jgi:hypothetical protein